MNRWETLTALAAVICAVLGATRLPGHTYATAAAIGLIATVGVSRLIAALHKQAPRR
jgi:hypothetical protein